MDFQYLREIKETQKAYNYIDKYYTQNNLLHIKKVFSREPEDIYFVFYDKEKIIDKSINDLSKVYIIKHYGVQQILKNMCKKMKWFIYYFETIGEK